MNQQQRVELRLRRDFIRLLAGALVLGLMALLLREWNRQQPAFDHSMAELMHSRLLTSVNLTRVQWMQHGRPQQISWSEPGRPQLRESMNMTQRGWPDAGDDCQRWWRLMMGEALSTGEISSVKIGDSCLVSYHSEPFLRYDSATGSVILLASDEQSSL